MLPKDPDIVGKVRDIYDFGNKLLLVATDRISAYDWVNPVGIPDKGRILTQLSAFWFELTAHICENHMLSMDPVDFPRVLQPFPQVLVGRSMLVKKAVRMPVEVVLRLCLAGSAYRSYLANGEVCGIKLPPGLVEADALAQPLLTPATKAEEGHDINISYEEMVAALDVWLGTLQGIPLGECADAKVLASLTRCLTIVLFKTVAVYAQEEANLLLADGKLEWGIDPITGEIMLIDEAFTPDACRWWPREHYEPGRPQVGLDKEDVRRWLRESGWDMNSPPPPLPDEVVAQTQAKYMEAYTRITGLQALS